ncbi:MAG TPA: HDIG domain-containing protein [Balneolaceae bacterium]|nr:HDIG domain-containing protein [Balneolaceae bacterium]
MNFLNKVGLGSKSHPNAPLMGKKKKEKEEASSLRNNTYLRVLIIIAFLVILCFSIPQPYFKQTLNYSIGTPWKNEDLTAPFTFAIQKSDKEIKQEKKAAQQNTIPIYVRQNNATIKTKTRLDSVLSNIQPVVSTYIQWKSDKTDTSKKAKKDSLNFIQQKNAANVSFSDQTWVALLEHFRTSFGQRHSANTGQQFMNSEFVETLRSIVDNVLNDGIINKPKNKLKHDKITVRNLQQHTEQTYGLANIRDVQQAGEYARYKLSQHFNDGVIKAGLQLFNQIIQPNLQYAPEQTKAKIQQAISNISKTKGAITKGQVIIRKGDLITPKKYQELKSLAEARSQNASNTQQWLQYGGEAIVIFSLIVIFFFYLYLYRRQIFMDNSRLLLVLLTLSVFIVASSLLFQLTNISLYIVPVAIAPILLTIIFDSRVGILSAVTLALLIGFINGSNFEFAAATIVGCCLGLFSVRDIKERSQIFFTTPGIVFLSYAVVVVGFNLSSFDGLHPSLNYMVYVHLLFNAVLVFLTYPIILLVEKSFDITTDLTLIELSDTNLPLLKNLMNKAPGTFHHSLQVANLAEAAAGNIQANGLLCRVASLYHDIGKMENPAYFSENQLGRNEHDKLKPRMSALVIKAHVSNGVKMANEYNLPEIITDFIKTHHGTSVIKYFYEKAKEFTDAEKDEIQEENYRYDGPLPFSKEMGIVMLADGVEAASRAMKDPNYQKLENLIDKLVEQRVNEGQLSRTPLTFQDLSIIKETFLNILVGIYHSRVEYPEDEEDKKRKEEAKKKTAEKENGEQPVPQKDHASEAQTSSDSYYNS